MSTRLAERAEQFFYEYAARSNIEAQLLADLGQRAYRCACGEEGCEGWAMISAENVAFDREHGFPTRGIDASDEGWAPVSVLPRPRGV